MHMTQGRHPRDGLVGDPALKFLPLWARSASFSSVVICVYISYLFSYLAL